LFLLRKDISRCIALHLGELHSNVTKLRRQKIALSFHRKSETPSPVIRKDLQPIGVFILFRVFGSFRSYYTARLPRCVITGDVSVRWSMIIEDIWSWLLQHENCFSSFRLLCR